MRVHISCENFLYKLAKLFSDSSDFNDAVFKESHSIINEELQRTYGNKVWLQGKVIEEVIYKTIPLEVIENFLALEEELAIDLFREISEFESTTKHFKTDLANTKTAKALLELLKTKEYPQRISNEKDVERICRMANGIICILPMTIKHYDPDVSEDDVALSHMRDLRSWAEQHVYPAYDKIFSSILDHIKALRKAA